MKSWGSSGVRELVRGRAWREGFKERRDVIVDSSRCLKDIVLNDEIIEELAVLTLLFKLIIK